MSQDQRTYQRAAGAALTGLAAQAAITVALLVLLMYWRTEGGANAALVAATWLAGGGLAVWIALWIVYKQHWLERVESLEVEQLAQQHGADSSIFEVSADDLSVARRRLRWLYRWVLPVVSLGTAAYLIVMGVILVRSNAAAIGEDNFAVPANPLGLTAFCAGLAVIGFLLSRYMAGMARHADWAMLRGGAAYLMSVVTTLALVCIALVMAHSDFPGLLQYAAVIVPLLMIALGAEFVVNFVLEIYRPRKAGELPRPAFDSRVMGLLTAPDSIAASLGEALNYQFGFELTRSWFWRLLSRAFIWLVGFGVLTLIAASCVVIVEPNQRAIVTRFGRLPDAAPGSGLGPGLHLKLPWPMATAKYYDVTSVRAMRVGSSLHLKADEPILWDNEHYEGTSEPMLVAPPRDARALSIADQNAAASDDPEAVREKAPPNFLVNAEIIIHYHVDADRLIEYVRANADAERAPVSSAELDYDPARAPDARLRVIAEEQAARYLLAFDIDEWIGQARVTAGDELKVRIQAEADQANLGVNIAGVVVASVHPPKDVVATFHELVGAQQQKLTLIENARREALKTLSQVAGSSSLAQRIVEQIEVQRQMSDAATPAAIAEQELKIAQLIQEAGGEAAVMLADARAYRWTKENVERGRVLRFEPRAAAFALLPRYYPASQYLRILGTALKDARKTIIVADSDDLTIRADLKDQSSGFGGILGGANE